MIETVASNSFRVCGQYVHVALKLNLSHQNSLHLDAMASPAHPHIISELCSFLHTFGTQLALRCVSAPPGFCDMEVLR